METISWLKQISIFIKVAEQGSFSEAARHLDVSKSHVSKTINALENELGFALFLRSTRKIELTHDGEDYLHECRELLLSLEEGHQKLKQFADHPSGILRVTMAGIFGEEFVSPVLIKLAKSYPELKIEVHFDNRIVDLISERFDVAIRVGNLPNSSLIGQRIATRKEYVCAAPQYLKSHAPLLRPQDLKGHNCLGPHDHWNFKTKERMSNIEINGNFKSNNPRILLKAGLDGLGLIKLPGSYVSDYIKKGKLVEVLEKYNPGRVDIWAVTPTRQALNVNVKLFIGELKKFLNEEFPNRIF